MSGRTRQLPGGQEHLGCSVNASVPLSAPIKEGMEMNKYCRAVTKAMDWINSQMLTFDQGYYGIYERIRIDEHIRTNWCRPDCNAEYLRLLISYGKMTEDDSFVPLQEKLFSWLSHIQDSREMSVWKGSFPFYVTDGYIREPVTGESLYQNDNGKIIVSLCRIYRSTGENRYLEMAEAAARFWLKGQRPDGTFGVMDGKTREECRRGPCFVQWLVSAFFLLYQETGTKMYHAAARKGLEYLLRCIRPSGRCATSYELIGMEDWRPVSSETGILLYTLCVAYEVTENCLLLPEIERTGRWLLAHQEEQSWEGMREGAGGGIRNCDESCRTASKQDREELCDLVYTAGFSLQALVLAWRITKESKYRTGAIRLADFLTRIQCSGESPLWDGGWRGSYNMKTREWDGRCTQNNPIDEGGMYSVYTGWCCTNICIGLLELVKALEEEEVGCI